MDATTVDVHWTYGVDLAGYAQGSDTQVFETWADACEAYESFCREWAVGSDEQYEDGQVDADDDAVGTDGAFIESVLSDPSFPREVDQPYTITIRANDGLTYELWLQPTSDPVTDTES